MKNLFGDEIKVSWSKYIKSPEWRRKADSMRRQAGSKCQYCGDERGPLDVHHLTYERLGYERDEDLVVLCKACHRIADVMREREVRSVRALRAYENSVDTYASKKYGYDWRNMDQDEVYEEFDEWVRDRY